MSDERDDGLGMPLVEAMETQRAVRRLRPDPVDDDTVLRVLELATKAPTGSNLQSWEFVVVRDPDVKHQLARLNRQAWSIYRRLGKRQAKGHEPTLKIIDAVQWQADHFEEVPVVVVACLHGRSPVFGPPVLASSWYGSAYPAVQNLLLAARAVGLGATLTTLPLWSTDPGPPHPRPARQRDAGGGGPHGLADRGDTARRPGNRSPKWYISTVTGIGRSGKMLYPSELQPPAAPAAAECTRSAYVRCSCKAGDHVPRKGRARRFREARELKQGFDDGLFREGSGTLADVDLDADAEDDDDDFDDDDDWDDDDPSTTTR